MYKSVFITGGSRGIGRACAIRFAEAGYSVAFTYNESEDAAFELKEEISRIIGDPERVLAAKLDMDGKDPEGDLNRAIDSAKTYLGLKSFDVAVLNAGISRSGLITDMDPKDIESLINVNLRWTIYAARAFAKGMVEAKSGSIVAISSIWGLMGASCESVYAATKAGIIGFGKSLARELGPSGVRVNIIAPGVIDTDMNACYSAEELGALADATPLGRLGSPVDVAKAVYFIASEEADFITGQVLGVDGGIIV